MTWPTDADLEDLVARFAARTLPRAEWTHAAHIAVGTWYIRTFGQTAALAMLRTGIRALNDVHGVANTDADGYHETITAAYVRLIAKFLATHPPDATAAASVRAVLASPIAHQDALLAHYSEAALTSAVARRGWLDPDIAPL